MQLLPGTSDPADASHLSIDFDAGDADKLVHGTLDVHLRDDDSLVVKFRDAGM